MTKLSIDLETFCAESLPLVGVHRYAQTAEILLFGFAFDDDPVTVIDFTQFESLPKDVEKAVLSEDVRKYAFNAMFERTMLSHYFNKDLSADSWWCSMVMSYYCGLPGLLDAVSKLLWPDRTDKGKMGEGKTLIRYFCMPCKPTKVNKGRTRNYPEHSPEKWKVFKEYNKRDVETERDLRKIVERLQFPKSEHYNYIVDQQINDRGCNIDTGLVKSAINLNEEFAENSFAELKDITKLDNPRSNTQFLSYLQKNSVLVDNVQKGTLQDVLNDIGQPDNIRKAVNL